MIANRSSKAAPIATDLVLKPMIFTSHESPLLSESPPPSLIGYRQFQLDTKVLMQYIFSVLRLKISKHFLSHSAGGNPTARKDGISRIKYEADQIKPE